MKKSVSHYISELLFLHDCVILPEFGGFIGNKQSALLNTATGTLTPPTKQIGFNKNLNTNDGLLISHIENYEGITNKKAQEAVLNFTNKLNEKLKNSKVLRIDKIGLFTLGKEDNVIFMQDSSTNYSIDTFGMKSIYTRTVIRKTEIEQKVEATVKTIRTTSIAPKAILKAAAVILPLVALSYLSISQQDKINTIYTQMATLNLFSPTEIVEEVINPIPENVIEIEISPEIIETPIIEEVATPIITTLNTYYIIAGAFTKQQNANKMLIKLSNWNYKPEIVDDGSLLRVSYSSFNSRKEAIIELNKIRKENKSAWLLTK